MSAAPFPISNATNYNRGGYTVYALWCPLAKQIKYIGYTHAAPRARLLSHLAEARRVTGKPPTHKQLWLRELAEKGLTPIMRVLACFKRKVPAYRLEAELIAAIGVRRALLNVQPGNPNWQADSWPVHNQL